LLAVSGFCQVFVHLLSVTKLGNGQDGNVPCSWKKHVRCGMVKRHQIIIIIIILLALLLIAIVTWLFDIRIRRIDEKKPAVVSVLRACSRREGIAGKV